MTLCSEASCSERNCLATLLAQKSPKFPLLPQLDVTCLRWQDFHFISFTKFASSPLAPQNKNLSGMCENLTSTIGPSPLSSSEFSERSRCFRSSSATQFQSNLSQNHSLPPSDHGSFSWAGTNLSKTPRVVFGCLTKQLSCVHQTSCVYIYYESKLRMYTKHVKYMTEYLYNIMYTHNIDNSIIGYTQKRWLPPNLKC